MASEPPYSTVDGVAIARATFTKTFRGDLVGDGTVDFIGVQTPVAGSAAYVGIERITGALAGRTGTFVLQHSAHMQGTTHGMTITVAPDSATGDLVGLSGTFVIAVVEKQHTYTFDYELPAPA